MSIITIQIGQCGNQIGEKLFETIISDCSDTTGTLSSSFRFKPVAPPSQASLKLNENYVTESKQRFFSQEADYREGHPDEPRLSARAILIDMESKVVNKLIHKSNENLTWLFREENCYTQKKGSGNNW